MNTNASISARPLMLLVDGSSFLYRAFHAMPDLRGPAGQPVGAIQGMVNMMQRLKEQYPAEHLACVFDAKGPTFRDDWYPQYKATRSPMPDDLRAQIEPIHRVVKLLGWPVLEVPGVEADDVIGTLTRRAVEQGHQVVIATGDKDLAQLVEAHVQLVNTMSGEVLDEAGVQAKFGVPPNRIVDYLSLVGDTVDNVPGVEKVGPKTAVKWLDAYGSLDNIVAAADDIKGAVGENLRRALDWLPMAKRLVTVRCDCDLSEHLAGYPQLEGLALRDQPQSELLSFYVDQGFKTLRRELEASMNGGAPTADGASAAAAPALSAEPGGAAPAAAVLSKNYRTILTESAFEDLLSRLRQATWVAMDTETDSLDPMQARLVGLSFSTAVGEGDYVPVAHDGPGAPVQLSKAWVLERLRPWLEDPAAAKVGQHIKYDSHVLANEGVNVRGWLHDTMLMSYVLEAHLPHGLEKLAQRHLGRHGISYESLCGKGAQAIGFSQVDVERASEYACEDSDMTLHLAQTLWPQIEAQAGLRYVYEKIEMPVSQVLLTMERTGVLIDSQVLRAQSHALGERLLQLEKEAHDLAGQPFNLGSPKQIGEILFQKLGLPVKKKTATGAPSTDEEVLAELAQDYPLPARILENRGIAKLKSTYTDKLPLMVLARTGRIHSHYAQAVAVTGRLSSQDPNLQNIPIRTAEGRKVREAFIAPPGWHVLSADYSQVELRIMAQLSGDEGMQTAFAQGVDIHRATAAEVFGVELSAVTAEQRRYAKAINFGLIYGMSAFGLAASLGIERSAAGQYIERYFTRYPGVRAYMERTKVEAREQGFVETAFGRRLWLPEIRSPNGPRKAAAERQAINAPMQGTAADLIKLAMLRWQALLESEGRQTRLLMQVHDELVCEVPAAELAWVQSTLPKVMAGVVDWRVPLEAEVGVGLNWDQAH